jgi:hypothetical protein
MALSVSAVLFSNLTTLCLSSTVSLRQPPAQDPPPRLAGHRNLASAIPEARRSIIVSEQLAFFERTAGPSIYNALCWASSLARRSRRIYCPSRRYLEVISDSGEQLSCWLQTRPRLRGRADQPRCPPAHPLKWRSNAALNSSFRSPRSREPRGWSAGWPKPVSVRYGVAQEAELRFS